MNKGIIFLLAGIAGLAACSHKQSSTQTESLAWNEATILETFQKSARHDPQWEAAAERALTAFARLRSNPNNATSFGLENIGNDAEDAVKAGCEDPMVRYLYCRFGPSHERKPLNFWQDEWRKTAQAMENSSYHSLRKFYANDRAANVLWADRNTNLWSEVWRLRQAAVSDFTAALEDKTLPIEEVSDAFDVLSDTIAKNNQQLSNTWSTIEDPLFRNWPQASAAWFIKGWFTYKLAWAARGGGWASKVQKEAWDEFFKTLGEAEQAYLKAWSLNPKDPRIANQMIEMAVSQQKDRSEMELWFQRAMALNTNNYGACWNKLRYLMPKWYGSREAMLEFGHQCVAATNWGGRVPLILVDAHYESVRTLEDEALAAYWRQPEVWSDIQSAYEKFFQMNPDVQDDYRYYYANYAYRAGQWQAFLTQINLIREQAGQVNSQFWGGRETLDQMIAQATQQLPKK